MRQRRIKVGRFHGYFLLSRGSIVVQMTHHMQPVRDLHQDNPDIACQGQHQFAVVFRVEINGVGSQGVDLRHAFQNTGNHRAKLLFNGLKIGPVAEFFVGHIVQHSGYNGTHSKSHFLSDHLGHFERMHQNKIAIGPGIFAKRLPGKIKSFFYFIQFIYGRGILASFPQIQPSVFNQFIHCTRIF